MNAAQTTQVRVRDYEVLLQSAGSGPPLLLLHGAGGAGMWLDLHARLAEHFTVFAPVQPGFAGTPLPAWVRGADDVALHTLDLVRMLGLESPVVVGLSLGGWIATEMAVFRPESIRRLVLVAPIGVKTEKPLPDLFIMEPLEALPYLFADVSKAMALMPAAPTPDVVVRMWEEQAAAARLAWRRPYNPSLFPAPAHDRVPDAARFGAARTGSFARPRRDARARDRGRAPRGHLRSRSRRWRSRSPTSSRRRSSRSRPIEGRDEAWRSSSFI